MKLSILNSLTLIFIVLKLTELIDWSWWLVFSPTIIKFILIIFIIIILTIYEMKK